MDMSSIYYTLIDTAKYKPLGQIAFSIFYKEFADYLTNKNHKSLSQGELFIQFSEMKITNLDSYLDRAENEFLEKNKEYSKKLFDENVEKNQKFIQEEVKKNKDGWLRQYFIGCLSSLSASLLFIVIIVFIIFSLENIIPEKLTNGMGVLQYTCKMIEESYFVEKKTE